LANANTFLARLDLRYGAVVGDVLEGRRRRRRTRWRRHYGGRFQSWRAIATGLRPGGGELLIHSEQGRAQGVGSPPVQATPTVPRTSWIKSCSSRTGERDERGRNLENAERGAVVRGDVDLPPPRTEVDRLAKTTLRPAS